MHRRFFPVQYRFVYRVFSLLLDLDRLDEVARRCRLFSHNAFNLFSFHDRDHGAGDGSPLRDWLLGRLPAMGLDLPIGGSRYNASPESLGTSLTP